MRNPFVKCATLTFTLLLCAAFTCLETQAQNDNNGYSREFIWGIKKSTNGGLISGLIGKKGVAINSRLFRTIGLELVNVKHPKESKVRLGNGRAFIVGKSNYLYSIRTQYGYDAILFKKASQQGVQINAISAIGPTIGLVAPYFVELEGGELKQNDPLNAQQKGIIGAARLFKGIEESKIKIGLNFKAALSFEFGTFKNSISGFETGFMVEAFPEKIALIPNENVKNRAVFTSVYISIIYGSRK